jgi:hypothetical protein
MLPPEALRAWGNGGVPSFGLMLMKRVRSLLGMQFRYRSSVVSLGRWWCRWATGAACSKEVSLPKLAAGSLVAWDISWRSRVRGTTACPPRGVGRSTWPSRCDSVKGHYPGGTGGDTGVGVR